MQRSPPPYSHALLLSLLWPALAVHHALYLFQHGALVTGFAGLGGELLQFAPESETAPARQRATLEYSTVRWFAGSLVAVPSTALGHVHYSQYTDHSTTVQ
jgi:hypothetical protein